MKNVFGKDDAKEKDDGGLRRTLVGELFGPMGASIPAFAAAIVVGIVGVEVDHRTRFAVVLAILVAISAARLALLRAYASHPELRRTDAEVRRWEMAYGSLAGAWALALGIDCGGLMMGGTTVLQLFATIMAVGMTGGLAARHSPRPWIVAVQITAVLAPYATALAMIDEPHRWGLVAMAVLLFWGVWSATKKSYANLRMALVNARDNGFLMNRFSSALDNMNSGLVMFDQNQALEVANANFLSMFRLKAADLQAGSSLEAVVNASIAAFPNPTRSPEEYVAFFEAGMRKAAPFSHTLDMMDGRSIEFRFRPITGGASVIMMEDVTDIRRAAERIERLAHYDDLTGLPNRSNFNAAIEERIAEASKGGDAFSLLYLDLDGFKKVNDTLGHPVGDRLLVEVAQRLRASLRQQDPCYRLGGDEFVVMQFAAEGADETLASRLIERVSEPYMIEGSAVTIALSVGIARHGADGADGEALLKSADIALYKAKEAGRKTFRRFRPEMMADAIDRAEREADLRTAIEEGAIDVHFQPIVDPANGRVRSCEALLRWFHPTRGLMRPDETVRLAEATGLIVDLGAIVMRKACIEAAAWPEDVSVAVNLSAMQFRGGVVIEQITRALACSGLPARRLEVEITESVALGNLAAIRSTIDEVRSLGVKVSLDDFGTGYSSLAYLSQIPFDQVKMDRSFVVKLGSDPMAASLIRLMTQFVDGLGKEMVVEGVETPDQMAILRKLGVKLMQGYFFSRPKPAAELAGMLAGRGPDLKVAKAS